MAAAPTNAPNSGGVEPPRQRKPDLIDLNDLQALILPSNAKIFVPTPSFSEDNQSPLGKAIKVRPRSPPRGRMERGLQPSQPTPWPATVKTVAPYRLTRPRDYAALQTFKKSFVLLPLFSSVLSLC